MNGLRRRGLSRVNWVVSSRPCLGVLVLVPGDVCLSVSTADVKKALKVGQSIRT